MTDNEYKELEHYRKVFGTGDVASRGYVSVVKMLEQQIDILNEFKIKDTIQKGDKEYDRAVKIFNDMPKMILELKDLKDKLGIEYVEKENRVSAISPQAIAKLTQ